MLIQACARSWLTRRRRRKEQEAASARVIQRSWQRRQKKVEGRKLLEIMKYRDNTPQIVLIQRSFKKHFQSKKKNVEVKERAAIIIQVSIPSDHNTSIDHNSSIRGRSVTRRSITIDRVQSDIRVRSCLCVFVCVCVCCSLTGVRSVRGRLGSWSTGKA